MNSVMTSSGKWIKTQRRCMECNHDAVWKIEKPTQLFAIGTPHVCLNCGVGALVLPAKYPPVQMDVEAIRKKMEDEEQELSWASVG